MADDWNKMTEDDKKPFKDEYEAEMEEYNTLFTEWEDQYGDLYN